MSLFKFCRAELWKCSGIGNPDSGGHENGKSRNAWAVLPIIHAFSVLPF